MQVGEGKGSIGEIGRESLPGDVFPCKLVQDSDGWQPQLGRSLAMSSVTTNNLTKKIQKNVWCTWSP